MGTLALNEFSLLDVQFMTDHLRTMGAKEISRALFLNLIKKSTSEKVQFKTRASDINIINSDFLSPKPITG